MNGVFLDTVGLAAIWDRNDQWHAPAVAAWVEVVAADSLLFTTTFVIAECANAAARRPYRTVVERLRLKLKADGGLMEPAADEWENSWATYAAGHIGGPGLVDEISFTVMRRLGSRQAFTNDRHFTDAGFDVLF